MPRYKLTVEYDGGPFSGWQRQENVLSVQQTLENAALNLDPEASEVYGAGRTDAGVHAFGQVAHVDLVKDLPDDTVRDALNAHIGRGAVTVLNAERVGDDFHARFAAVSRSYLYRLVDRRPPLTLDRGRVWRVTHKLDAAAMETAAQVLIGKHDFTTFRAAHCQAKSPMKTLDTIAVRRVGPEVHIACSSRSFLHRQVRSFAGSLVQVGVGKWTAEDLKAALEARDRAACGPVAPPDGLYLVRVDYALSAAPESV